MSTKQFFLRRSHSHDAFCVCVCRSAKLFLTLSFSILKRATGTFSWMFRSSFQVHSVVAISSVRKCSVSKFWTMARTVMSEKAKRAQKRFSLDFQFVVQLTNIYKLLRFLVFVDFRTPQLSFEQDKKQSRKRSGISWRCIWINGIGWWRISINRFKRTSQRKWGFGFGSSGKPIHR